MTRAPRLVQALPFAALLLLPAIATADDPVPGPVEETTPEPDVIGEDTPATPTVVTPDPVEPTYVEDVQLVGGSFSGENVGSMRSAASSWLILPRGWEAQGELHFLTSDAGPDGEAMRITDVVVTRASMRKSFGGKVELSFGIDALPKQPSYTDELIFQGADVGVRVGIKEKYAAYVGIGGGPMTADSGWFTTTSTGLQRRAIVHDTLSFQFGAGASLTGMANSDANGSTAWLGEAVVRGQTLFRGDSMFGVWLGADFAFPVAHGGTLMGAAFDPRARVDLSVGGVYSVVEDWDVYLQLAVIDRGDAVAPETQLPILQGGFDQRVITFGVTRHFGQDDDDGSWDGDDLNLAY